MLTNEKEKKICAKYSAYDENHRVHCNLCPLAINPSDPWDFRCKANSHYNRSTKEWEYDDVKEIEI